MYDPSSGEIEKPTAEREPLVPVRGQPPTLVPGDVRHDRVHEGRQQARQQEVGDHVAPLGDRARDDRRGRRRETQPEEPLRLPPKARLPNRRGVDVAKAGRAEDAVGARISKAVVAVRDGVAHDPPARRADGDVHDVFKQYLFRVILRAGADFQHGEALLHRENPDLCKNRPVNCPSRNLIYALTPTAATSKKNASTTVSSMWPACSSRRRREQASVS
mmetsp:Transcript_11252/g.30720  ORF Transcript_11252/g.30720 Transcript_11252/m.30720 type:complete len:218 (-) Transcript_11252:198-851(-)